MRKIIILLFAMFGAVPPIIWIYEFSLGHYLYKGSVLEKIAPFFPAWILLLAVPSATGWVEGVVFFIASVVNVVLYMFVGWLFIRLFFISR